MERNVLKERLMNKDDKNRHFSGHYGYKSHNFNVIPEKIKALVPVCS
jgi:hypothetical protein